MKRCPTCSRVYDDLGLRFCMDDGTELVNKPLETPAPSTLVMSGPEIQPTIPAFQPPPPPPPPAATVAAFQNKRQRNIIIWVLALAIGLPLIAGVAFGIWKLTHRGELTWRLVLEVDPNAPDRQAAVKQVVAIIDRRLDALGLSNYEIKPDPDSGSGRIIINLPTVDNPERIKQIVTTYGKLELVHVISPASPYPLQTYATKEEAITSLGGNLPANRRVLPYAERDEPTTAADTSKSQTGGHKRWVVVEAPAIVDGTELRTATAAPAVGERNNYQISFSLKPAGAEKFGAWTGANINQYLGIVLNDEVKSAPFIKGQIYDQGEISGRFTKQSAEDLALVLRAGALPVPVKLVEETINK